MKKFLTVLAVVLAFSAIAGKSSKTSEDGSGYALTGLKPNHSYVLCINGYSDHESNETLLKIGECWRRTGEGYIDFGTASTDADGNLNPSFQNDLPSGSYKVKFLVKDPDNDWKVIWNVDEVVFNVN